MSSYWKKGLDERQRLTVEHAQNYAQNYAGAGAVGHNSYLLLAQLADKLDEYENTYGIQQAEPEPEGVAIGGDPEAEGEGKS